MTAKSNEGGALPRAPAQCSLCGREKDDLYRAPARAGGRYCPADPVRDSEHWRLAYQRAAARSAATIALLAGANHELAIAYRFLFALGRQDWPDEAELREMEAEQDKMRLEYEADVRRENGEQ